MNSAPVSLPLPPATAHVTVFRSLNPNYVAVFVEGPDDVETWKPWLKWRPFPVGGCAPLLATITSLRAAGETGFVGIIDANCERLEGRDHSAADVVVTENHDLECDLIQLPALDRLIGVVDDQLIAGLIGQQSFRDALLERALPFGFLRWHFFRLGTAYEPGRLSPHRFVDERTWALDETGLLHEASLVLNQPVPALTHDLAALRAKGAGAWDVCNGHDLLKVLAIALRGPLGVAAKYPQSTAVGSALRLAVDSSHRATLHVWRALLAWQAANPPWVACEP